MSALPGLVDGDAADAALLASVHPPAWTNPTAAGRYNLVAAGRTPNVDGLGLAAAYQRTRLTPRVQRVLGWLMRRRR